VLAHVHNGNLSNGMAFNTSEFNGTPMDAAYATERARWEPIAEITQIKGDGETHPKLSPDDEFADFERWVAMGAPDPRTAAAGGRKPTGMTVEQGRSFWAFQPGAAVN